MASQPLPLWLKQLLTVGNIYTGFHAARRKCMPRIVMPPMQVGHLAHADCNDFITTFPILDW
jgi:hypothetical protein